jgi:hypothetical protein
VQTHTNLTVAGNRGEPEPEPEPIHAVTVRIAPISWHVGAAGERVGIGVVAVFAEWWGSDAVTLVIHIVPQTIAGCVHPIVGGIGCAREDGGICVVTVLRAHEPVAIYVDRGGRQAKAERVSTVRTSQSTDVSVGGHIFVQCAAPGDDPT